MAAAGPLAWSNKNFLYTDRLIIARTLLSENRFALYVLLLSDLLKSNPLLGIRRQIIPFCLHNSEHLIENACAICLSPMTRFAFFKYSFVFPVMLLCQGGLPTMTSYLLLLKDLSSSKKSLEIKLLSSRRGNESLSQMLRGSRKSHIAKLRLNEATRIASSLISTPKILFFKRRFSWSQLIVWTSFWDIHLQTSLLYASTKKMPEPKKKKKKDVSLYSPSHGYTSSMTKLTRWRGV